MPGEETARDDVDQESEMHDHRRVGGRGVGHDLSMRRAAPSGPPPCSQCGIPPGCAGTVGLWQQFRGRRPPPLPAVERPATGAAIPECAGVPGGPSPGTSSEGTARLWVGPRRASQVTCRGWVSVSPSDAVPGVGPQRSRTAAEGPCLRAARSPPRGRRVLRKALDTCAAARSDAAISSPTNSVTVRRPSEPSGADAERGGRR